MAETLGSLCDKLTIVKLKQWHTNDKTAQASLGRQESQLLHEIDELFSEAVSGHIPLGRLTFAANKVYKKEGNAVAEIGGTIGEVFSHLADVNCRLWHTQERVYEFESVPTEDKNAVIKQLALLNLERTGCIDRIDILFKKMIETSQMG